MTAYTDKRRNNRLQTGGYNAYMFPGCYGNWGYSNMNWGYRDWDRWSSSPTYNKRTGSGHKSVMNKPRGDFGHKETDSFVYFFRQSSPFSQWYPSEFSVDGRKFNCAEQYMMFRKASKYVNFRPWFITIECILLIFPAAIPFIFLYSYEY